VKYELKRSWKETMTVVYFKVLLSQKFPKKAKRIHAKIQSVQPTSGLILEVGSSRI
jgi:hypothetical protein